MPNTRTTAQWHMDNWNVDSADPKSISILIAFGKAILKENAVIMSTGRYTGQSAHINAEIREEITFWNRYIAWGTPIVTYWANVVIK